jgi:phosphoglycerol transferase MdoB-like AlkP superfamily enzyme
LKSGYRTGFYYGATLSFDNRARYFLSGYDVIVTKKDFDEKLWGSPWGVHDPAVLNRLFIDLDSASAPLFAAALTLSSHEPFSVPGKPVIAGSDPERRFLNAQAFTDRSVDAFLSKLHETKKWDSTLIVIVGDHGHIYPRDNSPFFGAPESFRIPMIWAGGALSVTDTTIQVIGSQLDIPSVLLDQVDIDASDFVWGKNFLDPDRVHFAFYALPDAFGYVDDHGAYLFDNAEGQVAYKDGNPPPSSVSVGQSFQQLVTETYLSMAMPPVNNVQVNH